MKSLDQSIQRLGSLKRILSQAQPPIHGARSLAVVSGFAVMAVLSQNAAAADLQLKPETQAAWNEYIENAKCSMKDRLKPGGHFLWMDEDAQRSAKVKNRLSDMDGLQE